MNTNPVSYKLSDWLPTSAKEVKARGWESIDVILFSGDAYVDHPSFGAAVIGRVLEAQGVKVAIVPQPNWRDDLRDFKKLGTPNLFFAISAGCMDSMVNHYTANKRLRSDDAYTPDGKPGMRPDYATTVYCNMLKELYPDVPVIIGGIEASLRRVTHYDYWSDQLMPTILHSSKADLLVYGMGEKPIIEVVNQLKAGKKIGEIRDVPQTAWLQQEAPDALQQQSGAITLASHQECLKDKMKQAMNFRQVEEQSNRWQGTALLQQVYDRWLVINPLYPPMEEGEIDHFFDLPYTRLPHPRYKDKQIAAYEMIRHSITAHRGCFGGCAFCTISAHQGKFIASRSRESIAKEMDAITQMPDFKGYISDIGGPSANMYGMKGQNPELCKACRRPSCIDPAICKNLSTSHRALLEIYQLANRHPQIKKAFIGSGIRYDLIFADGQNTPENLGYMREVVQHHVSGRLKVAPEHTSESVLKVMRKPPFELFKRLLKFFEAENKKAGLKQQLIPYFISSHPGSRKKDMAMLMLETKELNFKLEQVQDFTPTPMTLATEIYYTGIHPYTLKPVYTARTQKEKLEQRKFFFWYKPEYRREIEKELREMGLK
ncbi:MAG TPA: YgiQ family radical SAM protein [Prolixibacteraceae bacterium]|nr:YgiQ family radical SAM protein [Prolixibacteraceae bacterium]HPS12846.1 YgiQ family radical SAM protein [Prolixibacteraceae bacterium]